MNFKLLSFAKINLTLRVYGRRASDGLHEVATHLQTISLHDELTFAPSEDSGFRLTCDALDVPNDKTNLVAQANLLLRERFNLSCGARIELKKRIPVQAGLGGGSSNAAMALIGLARLWNLRLEDKELAELGAELGADVPFFFAGGTAFGAGKGERIELLEDVARKPLLIVMPDATVSTAEAYQSLARPVLTNRDLTTILRGSRLESLDRQFFERALHNDFESVVFERYSQTRLARDKLLELGAQAALLSGSGASVFGVFDNDAAQRRAFESLQQTKNWRAFACDTLSRKEYLNESGIELARRDTHQRQIGG